MVGSSINNGDERAGEREVSSEFVSDMETAEECKLDFVGDLVGAGESSKGSLPTRGPLVVLRGSGARVDGLRVCFEAISVTIGSRNAQMLLLLLQINLVLTGYLSCIRFHNIEAS